MPEHDDAQRDRMIMLRWTVLNGSGVTSSPLPWLSTKPCNVSSISIEVCARASVTSSNNVFAVARERTHEGAVIGIGVRIEHDGHARRRGATCLSISSDFPTIEYSRNEKPVILPSGTRHAGDEALGDRIVDYAENDRDRPGRLFERGKGWRPNGNNEVWSEAYQLKCIIARADHIAASPALLDTDAPSLGPA